jgi:hypothetical protein
VEHLKQYVRHLASTNRNRKLPLPVFGVFGSPEGGDAMPFKPGCAVRLGNEKSRTTSVWNARMESVAGTSPTWRRCCAMSVVRGKRRKHLLRASISPFDPGCVKTCASRECVELSSLLSPFDCDCDCECCSFPIQRNRDKSSTCKFDIGVFTQPGPKADNRTSLWKRPFDLIPMVQDASVLVSRCEVVAAPGWLIICPINSEARIVTKQKRSDRPVSNKEYIAAAVPEIPRRL